MLVNTEKTVYFEEKMIEEMAKCYKCKPYLYEGDVRNCQYLRVGKMCDRYKIAKDLYNEGYRKIPEGAVVLTREEQERIEQRVSALEKRAEGLKQVRKETAREVLDKVDYESNGQTH